MRLELKRRMYVTAGMVSLVLGIIGIPLPLLPTTPFLILAAFCFSRGSERFHMWLINHRLLGSPIRDWRENHSIAVEFKIAATAMMVVGYALLYWKFSDLPLAASIAYFLLILPGLAFLWTRKSRR